MGYQWIATMWPQKTTLIFMKNNLMSESWVGQQAYRLSVIQ